MSDDVRRWSDELARDPGSLIFLQLGETLRRQGQVELATKVAIRGLERHPHNADAHDLLARIAADRGDLQRAFDEWDMVLRLRPGHAGALKGMGFIRFQEGRLEDADGYLSEAVLADGDDPSIHAALAHVRQHLADSSGSALPPAAPHAAAAPQPAHERMPAPEGEPLVSGGAEARALFADVLGDGPHTALLLDSRGLVLAGAYVTEDGGDVAQEVGAELSGVSDEARRAMRHLGLGDWTMIIMETDAATVAMAPAPGDALLVVAADRATPLGFVRRLVDRAAVRARNWLAAAGGER